MNGGVVLTNSPIVLFDGAIGLFCYVGVGGGGGVLVVCFFGELDTCYLFVFGTVGTEY